MKDVAKWLGGNWGWVVLIFSVFFEITPVKFSPISGFLGWIGKKLNGPIAKQVEELSESLTEFKTETEQNFQKVERRQDAAEKEADMQRMAGIKQAVLDFANSCMNGRKHTKEEFDHIISENAVYQSLVQKHGIKNEVYTESYRYILRVYRICLDEHKFLVGAAV